MSFSESDCNLKYYTDEYDIILHVEDKNFYTEKKTLADKCPYFDAMFTRNFQENSQEEITIKMISPDIMKCALDFMIYEKINFNGLEKIDDILMAACFFQLQSLMNTVERELAKIVSLETWYQLIEISKKYQITGLCKKAKLYGLLNFESIRNNIQIIENLRGLHWYLSHISLKVYNEYDVFETGYSWLKHYNLTDDEYGIAVILSCLNFNNINLGNLKNISSTVKGHKISTAILDFIFYLKKNNIYVKDINEHKSNLAVCENENLIETVSSFLSTRERMPPEKVCIISLYDDCTNIIYHNYKTNDFKAFFIDDRLYWGAHFTVWKDFNILMLCGKARSTDCWNLQIKMFNSLHETSVILNTNVTPRRHGCCIIDGDELYLIGGVGPFRVVLSSAVKYNLSTGFWETLPNLPEACQMPVATFHNGELYVAAESMYVYRNNNWDKLFKLPARMNSIVSYNDNLYFTVNWKCNLYRLKLNNYSIPVIEDFGKFSTLDEISSMCISGPNIYFFAKTDSLTEPDQMEFSMVKHNLNGHPGNQTVLWTEMCSEYLTEDTLPTSFVIPNIDFEDIPLNDYGEKWIK